MNQKQRKRKIKSRSGKNREKELVQALQSLPQPRFLCKLWATIPPVTPKPPKGPRPGAAFSTRQMPTTFNTESGLSNVGGSSGAAQLIQSGSSSVLVAIAFRLDDCGQSSTFSSLFDQYRIDKVVLRFYTRNNSTSVFNVAAPNSSVPLGYVTQDLDDATAPASLNAVREYDKCVTFTGNTSFDLTLTPRPTAALYAAGAFSGYQTLDVEPWIDIANADVPHYGVKLAVGALTATTTSSFVWDIEAHYWLSFRNTR